MRQTTDNGRVHRVGQQAARRGPGRLALAVGIGAWLMAGTAAGADGGNQTASAGPTSAMVRAIATASLSVVPDREARIRPKLRGDLPMPVRRKLSVGFAAALERVRSVESCAQLFDRLGASGAGILAFTRYSAAAWNKGSSGCQTGVAAFTGVGSPHTRLCSGFARLSADGAAVILLHEALHTAGMTESPAYPGALTSQEINLLVKTSCGL